VREFDELTEDLSPEERRRLRRVHELLLETGRPAELPASLRRPPRMDRRPGLRPGWRPLAIAFAGALAIVVASFTLGYRIGDDSFDFDHDFSVEMRGAEAAPNASATLEIADRDEAGNWPMVLKVRGLPELPAGGRYLLYLTKNGQPRASCGSFRVHAGTTTAPLSAPYRFDLYDGWVVRADLPGRVDTRPYLVSEELGDA
jgi:hypothetical protein